jgi:hypothetical protein
MNKCYNNLYDNLIKLIQLNNVISIRQPFLIFHSGQPSHGGNRNIFEVMTSTLPKGTLGSVASLLAATLYQRNPDRNHKRLGKVCGSK